MAEIIDLALRRATRQAEPRGGEAGSARIYLFDGVRIERFVEEEPRPQLRRASGSVRGDER